MNHDFRPPLVPNADGTTSRATSHLASERVPGWSHRSASTTSTREERVRFEERRKERARIARDLHDTLFQGFLGASMVLETAVHGMPEDSPSRPSLSRALELMRRVFDEGRDALRGLRAPGNFPTSLEQGLAELGEGFSLAGTEFRVFVIGRSLLLNPRIQEQIYLIAREALANAFRHSRASSIELEIEYLPGKLRLVVRDNGSGIDQGLLHSGRDSHWGLLGMRERARSIGAQLRVLSRKGAGTEVEISISGNIAARGSGRDNRKVASLRVPPLQSESVSV